jgi:transposase InsO family protein
VPERFEFASLEVSLSRIEARRRDYNQRRQHGSLGHLTPDGFVNGRQAE